MLTTTMRLQIEGEKVAEVVNILEGGYLPLVELDDGTEWYVAEDHEAAGQAARKYWAELAENDPTEFACLIGEETLVRWGMNQYAGPGTTQVRNLAEWLDLWLDTPEEEFASYDGHEKDVLRCGKLAEELGFTPTLAYRHN